ncbi:MAG: hypothetical protein LDL07_00505 [Desulfarculus sp.]|jgi:hypothetical protein|nr:hypothetical protein [Desulfarculus sp.]
MRKFLEYAVTEGKTVLSGPELTRRFSDIDGRLHVLEELKVGWEAAVLQVQNHGLARINNVLQPILDQARAEIDAIGSTLVDIQGQWVAEYAAIAQQWAAIAQAYAELDQRPVEIYVPAAAMTPTDSDGAEALTLVSAGHQVNRDAYVFGPAAPSHVQFQLALPGDWDRGPFKLKAYWQGAPEASAGETVTWAVRAKAVGQGQTIDAAWSVATQMSGLVSAAGGGGQEISGPSPALTPAGEISTGCLLDFDLCRLTGGPGDSIAGAWLHGVLLQYLAVAKPEAW